MQVVKAPRASAILYHVLKGQKNGNPWLVPANVCPIVPITFFKAAVPFEFVDISAETLHINQRLVELRLAQGPVGGLLYVHTYGEESVPTEFFRRLKSGFPGLLIIDDRCLCRPETRPDQALPADVTLYSTGYAKIVDFDYGGYAFLSDGTSYTPEPLPYDPGALAAIKESYDRSVGLRLPYDYVDCDWLQTDGSNGDEAYFARIESVLETTLSHRTAVNREYAARLPREIQLSEKFQGWRFNVRLRNRDRILDAIFASGLFASRHYASLTSIMAPGHCPNADQLSCEILNLFNDHRFTVEMARKACCIIMDHMD